MIRQKAERRIVAAPLSREDFRKALARERARADRNEHHFSVVLLHGKGQHSPGDAEDLIKSLAGRIRIIDEIGRFDEKRIGLILPHTSSSGARKLVDSIRHMLPASCVFTIYTYPGRWLPEEPPESRSGSQGDKETASSEASGVSLVPAEMLFDHGIPVWKRAMDIVLAAVALVILSPLFAAVAMTIALVSPGPVFLKQKRVGYQGKSFMIWKFRTMRVDADTGVHRKHIKTLMTADVPMTKLDMKGDPRIIPGGNFIRGCCLDELPQLINVLRGDMSLVGPRPCLAFEGSQYRPWQRMRCDAVPGMTGLWQVSGKNKTTFNQMMRLDVAYVRLLSLALDVRILLRTFPAVVTELMNALRHRREDRGAPCRVRARSDSQ